jgi:hypothetical protein
VGARGMLAGLIAALAVGVALHLAAGSRPPSPAPVPRAALLLDPTPYRGRIAAIEAILHREGPARLGDGERVGGLALTLAREVADREPGIAGRDAFRRLAAFAGEVDAEADAGYAPPRLARARAAWEAIRAEVFRP